MCAIACLALAANVSATEPVQAPAPSSSSALQRQMAAVISAAARDKPSSAPGSQRQTLGSPFATRHASYQPVPFATLPGWSSDNLLESLNVFQRSCTVLSAKAVWAATCAALDAGDTASSASARQFFQTRFNVYQVRNLDENPTGLFTGYYEPQLDGRRQRDERFRYPVYARPHDLYQLDARSLSGAPSQWFVVDGHSLKAVAAGTTGASAYRLQLGGALPGFADKRYRVRIDGHTIRPYWTRQQIARHGVNAAVLAWVDNAWVLYSMQVQGTGRIRMDDGSVIRLAYAGRNGQAFMPQASSRDTALAADAIKTRGLEAAGVVQGNDSNASVAAIIARLQGGKPSTKAAAAAVPPDHTAIMGKDPSVQAIIDRLQGNGATATAAAANAGASPAATTTKRTSDPQVQAMIAMLLGNTPSSGGGTTAGSGDAEDASTGISDPGYVFFREVPLHDPGPPGALGVALTPGRSLAVDPRTTPLGAPVFVETARPDADGDIQRLMIAQDTSNAIRGSVRGDFFLGAGHQAGSTAAAMNASGRMWLLLPKNFHLAAADSGIRVRGLGDHAGVSDCVIPDGETCVDATPQPAAVKRH